MNIFNVVLIEMNTIVSLECNINIIFKVVKLLVIIIDIKKVCVFTYFLFIYNHSRINCILLWHKQKMRIQAET